MHLFFLNSITMNKDLFKSDIGVIKKCLASKGFNLEEDTIFEVWQDYSDGFCAGWMAIPNNTKEILEVFKNQLINSKKWNNDFEINDFEIIETLGSKITHNWGLVFLDNISHPEWKYVISKSDDTPICIFKSELDAQLLFELLD